MCVCVSSSSKEDEAGGGGVRLRQGEAAGGRRQDLSRSRSERQGREVGGSSRWAERERERERVRQVRQAGGVRWETGRGSAI